MFLIMEPSRQRRAPALAIPKGPRKNQRRHQTVRRVASSSCPEGLRSAAGPLAHRPERRVAELTTTDRLSEDAARAEPQGAQVGGLVAERGDQDHRNLRSR